MKTKKAILEWWESRTMGDRDDLTCFNENIDPTLKVEWNNIERRHTSPDHPHDIIRYDPHSTYTRIKRAVISKPSWKHSLQLYFSKQECFRIVGF